MSIKDKEQIIKQVVQAGKDVNAGIFDILHSVNDLGLGQFDHAITDIENAFTEFKKAIETLKEIKANE